MFQGELAFEDDGEDDRHHNHIRGDVEDRIDNGISVVGGTVWLWGGDGPVASEGSALDEDSQFTRCESEDDVEG